MSANEEREKLKLALDNLVVNADVNKAVMRQFAESMFHMFNCYIKAGFTPEQALNIIIARGLA